MAKRKRDPSKPTPKMKRLYREFVDYFGEEPADLWVYAPEPDVAGRDPDAHKPTLKHVMVWPATDDVEVCVFQTLGMSEQPIPGTDEFAELNMGIRAYLGSDQRERVARFLANVTEYPFHYGRTIDWWHVLSSPGTIPEFPGCPHLMFHPRFVERGRDVVPDRDGPVKLLHVVPITPRERHLLVDHGADAFADHVAEIETDLFRDRTDTPDAP